MRAIIIDDEVKARENLKTLLKLLNEDIQLAGEAINVKSGIALIGQVHPDLVFLDINMPDGSGFDLLQQIGSEFSFKLIFVTAFEEYAIKAFDFSAIDYILKPIDPEKLKSSIIRAKVNYKKEQISEQLKALFSNLDLQNKVTKKLVLATEQKIHIVETKNIIRCQSDGGYTTFHMIDNTKIVVSKNLKNYEELLQECDFFRTHQSHLINLNYIDFFTKRDGGYISLKNGHKIPIAQRKKDLFFVNTFYNLTH